MQRHRLPRQPLIRVAPIDNAVEQRQRWLEAVVKCVLVMNLLDAMFTLWWVRTGLATEANAFLRDLVEAPLSFVLAKIALVSLGSIFLWRLRQRPLAVIAICCAFLTYSLVLLLHLRLSGLLLAQLSAGSRL